MRLHRKAYYRYEKYWYNQKAFNLPDKSISVPYQYTVKCTDTRNHCFELCSLCGSLNLKRTPGGEGAKEYTRDSHWLIREEASLSANETEGNSVVQTTAPPRFFLVLVAANKDSPTTFMTMKFNENLKSQNLNEKGRSTWVNVQPQQP